MQFSTLVCVCMKVAMCLCPRADCFPNHVYVPDIEAPAIVLHGEQDEVRG